MVQFQLTDGSIVLYYHQVEQGPQLCDIVGCRGALGALILS